MNPYCIYDRAFPMPDAVYDEFFALLDAGLPRGEHRSREDQRRLFELPSYRVFTRSDDKKMTALLAVWEITGYTFIEHFVVSKELRGRGIGGELLEYCVSVSGRPAILEAERPETDIARRRIGFYERHGFHANEYGYSQPALNRGDAPLPLVVMSRPAPLTKSEFEKAHGALTDEVYSYCYDL